MAMYEEKKAYTDLEKGEYLKSGKRVEMTVKRAEYVNKKLQEHGVTLERLKEE
ncbi:hypothetical protein EIG95_16320 [Staphylococcus aureus]|uniref:hypothetical protein n=1 Tax=Staphylococcus aureus TaxID=1280 RepID=UPI001022A29F|nr:hypothetical protein [Staphylococcus aureus]RZH79719.1 hypothetical protein EIG95_16320 [Staphylococcus aureus]